MVHWIALLLGYVVLGEHRAKLRFRAWTPLDSRDGPLATIQLLKIRNNIGMISMIVKEDIPKRVNTKGIVTIHGLSEDL